MSFIVSSPPSLTIVVPCYNEEEVFLVSLEILLALLRQEVKAGNVTLESKILFVDDGSSDKTWSLIEEASLAHTEVLGLKLSRNVGHQVALYAGLCEVETDICVSIDADLQDDVKVIPKMIENYRKGDEIVYGIRKDRSSDSLFKRQTAAFYYALMKKMVPNLVPQHADFRLLGPRALKAFKSYRVKNLYLRGIIPELGFKTSRVAYKRLKRQAGESHYPLFKMLHLAWDGITSQTLLPLRFISFLGMVSIFFALLGFAYALYSWLWLGTVAGWTSLESTIIFFGAIQLFSIGVLGEYLAKVKTEVTDKPLYFIEQKLW